MQTDATRASPTLRQRSARLARLLLKEIKADHLSNGAGALAFYMVLAIFPATTFALSLLPYLPIPHLVDVIMGLTRQVLPGGAAAMFTSTVTDVVSGHHGGLLSFGLLFSIWSAANGMYALMQQLNVVNAVKEERSFWRATGVSVLLSVVFFVLVVCTLGLVVFGGMLESWIGGARGWTGPWLTTFAAVRWVIILVAVQFALALVYRFAPAPDVARRFRLATPGSVSATLLLLVTSLGFKLYVSHFGSYNAIYGSIGAVIVLLVWLLLVGWAILLGAELDDVLTRSARARDERCL